MTSSAINLRAAMRFSRMRRRFWSLAARSTKVIRKGVTSGNTTDCRDLSGGLIRRRDWCACDYACWMVGIYGSDGLKYKEGEKAHSTKQDGKKCTENLFISGATEKTSQKQFIKA